MKRYIYSASNGNSIHSKLSKFLDDTYGLKQHSDYTITVRKDSNPSPHYDKVIDIETHSSKAKQTIHLEEVEDFLYKEKLNDCYVNIYD